MGASIKHYGLIGADLVLKAVWYTEISSGTTGQITVPAGGTLLLDEFASGVDALCVAMSGVGGFVTWETVEEADETVVAVASFDGQGNYTLSGTPASYPVAIVFVYTVTLGFFDYTKDFLEHEIPGIGGGTDFTDLADTPAAYSSQGGKLLRVNVGETAVEFVTDSVIDHVNIQNIGSNTHSQVDTHIADGTIHFIEGSIDHGSISGLGDNDHNQYLLTDCSNDPLTGNLEISKDDPEIKLTDTGDSGSARLTRADTNSVTQLFNTVGVPGTPGNALIFEKAKSERVNISGINNDIATATAGTISMWVKIPADDDTQQAFFSISRNADNTRTELIFVLDFRTGAIQDEVLIFILKDGSTSWQILSGVDSLDGLIGTWVHVLLTHNATVPELFINGVSVGTLAGARQSEWFNAILTTAGSVADQTLVGGYRRNGGVSAIHSNATIDELAIWTDVKSANDIADLYNAGGGLFIDKDTNFPTDGGSMGDNLVALYHHDEVALNTAPGGTDTEDSSALGNHGTAVGSFPGMVDGDFIPGKISTSSSVTEISIFKSQNGINVAEKGILTVGDIDSRLVFIGGDVADTGMRFYADTVEIARFDGETKSFIVNNMETTSPQIVARGAPGASTNILEVQDSSSNILMGVTEDGDVVIPNDNVAIKFGENEDASIFFDFNKLIITANLITDTNHIEFMADAYHFLTNTDEDIEFVFAGTSNNGTLRWMEDEDYFIYLDDILLNNDEKLLFRDTAIGIYSQANTFMDLFADGGIRIGDSSGGAPTNHTKFAPDGSITQIGTARIDWTKIAANGAAVTGCTTSSNVSDLQGDNDGNTYVCSEVVATPNYLTVDFTGVTAFNWIRVLANYQGNSVHNLVVQLEITPFDGSVWYTLNSIANQTAATMTIIDYSFFIPNDAAYINSGVVKVRILHSATTSNGHVWTFDEISLYQ